MEVQLRDQARNEAKVYAIPALIIVPARRISFSAGITLGNTVPTCLAPRRNWGFRRVGTAHQKGRIPHFAGCGRNDDQGRNPKVTVARVTPARL